jgi:hypothetical protein
MSQMQNANAPATPDVEGDPEPAGELGPREDRHADGDGGDEPGESEDRVRESEDRALPRLKVRSALHDEAEVAVQVGLGVDQDEELVHGQGEGRIPPDDAGDDQNNGEGERSARGGDIGHGRIIAAATERLLGRKSRFEDCVR